MDMSQIKSEILCRLREGFFAGVVRYRVSLDKESIEAAMQAARDVYKRQEQVSVKREEHTAGVF